jgi:hypothetical protein
MKLTILHAKRETHDLSTLVTMSCLGISAALFIFYDGFKYGVVVAKHLSDPLGFDEVAKWEEDNREAIGKLLAVLRHSGYCALNLAFAFNLARWFSILLPTEGSCNPIKVLQQVRRLLIITMGVFVGTAGVFMWLQFTG